MKPVTLITGTIAPLPRANVDTDQIMPKQFLKRVERTGYGEFLFWDWRRTADGELDPEFVLNRPEYQNANVLVTGPNFGSGSSREHAPWGYPGLGLRSRHRPLLRRHLLQQLLQDRASPGGASEKEVQLFDGARRA